MRSKSHQIPSNIHQIIKSQKVPQIPSSMKLIELHKSQKRNPAKSEKPRRSEVLQGPEGVTQGTKRQGFHGTQGAQGLGKNHGKTQVFGLENVGPWITKLSSLALGKRWAVENGSKNHHF